MDAHEFVEGLSDAHMECRELGHLWRPWRAALSLERNAYDRTLRCTRCRTQRVQILTLNGEIVSNRYVYPEGYTSKGVGRLTGSDRDYLRIASLTGYMDRKGIDHA